MPDTIESLIKRNLHEVFGERDTQKRREAIAQLWTEDCVFIDHSGKSHGAMNSIVRSPYCISVSRATFSVSFDLSICSTKRALGLELWTTRPGAYQGRRCGSVARWPHLSSADVP